MDLWVWSWRSRRVSLEPAALRALLEPWVVHGINNAFRSTICHPTAGFTPDGRPADPKVAEHCTPDPGEPRSLPGRRGEPVPGRPRRMAGNSPSLPHRRRRPGQAVAQALQRFHHRRPAGASRPIAHSLDGPENIVEVPPGHPARPVRRADRRAGGGRPTPGRTRCEAAFYVAESLDSLKALLAGEASCPPALWPCPPGSSSAADVTGPCPDAVRAADRVERARLAIQPPPVRPRATRPGRADRSGGRGLGVVVRRAVAGALDDLAFRLGQLVGRGRHSKAVRRVADRRRHRSFILH